MLFTIAGIILGTLVSFLLVRDLERRAEAVSGTPLHRWQRLLIRLPIIFFLAANLDDVLSLHSYMRTHPYALPIRYSGNRAWETERGLYAGLISIAILPFLLTRYPGRALRLVPSMCGGHTLWLIFIYGPLLLATGVPLQD
jgi:hypothetical protein